MTTYVRSTLSPRLYDPSFVRTLRNVVIKLMLTDQRILLDCGFSLYPRKQEARPASNYFPAILALFLLMLRECIYMEIIYPDAHVHALPTHGKQRRVEPVLVNMGVSGMQQNGGAAPFHESGVWLQKVGEIFAE